MYKENHFHFAVSASRDYIDADFLPPSESESGGEESEAEIDDRYMRPITSAHFVTLFLLLAV